jgi:hypothetical protein
LPELELTLPVLVLTPPVEVETPPVDVVELEVMPPVVVVLVSPPVELEVEPPEVELEPPELLLEVEPLLVEVMTMLPLEPPLLPPKKPPKKPPPKPMPPLPPPTITVWPPPPLSGIGCWGSWGTCIIAICGASQQVVVRVTTRRILRTLGRAATRRLALCCLIWCGTVAAWRLCFTYCTVAAGASAT